MDRIYRLATINPAVTIYPDCVLLVMGYEKKQLDSIGERIILNAPLEPAIGRIILKGLEAVNPAALIT